MLFLFLYLLWLLFNGRFAWDVLLLGFPVTGLAYFLCLRLTGLSVRHDLFLLRRTPAWTGYFFRLFPEVIRSAWNVMIRIWRPGQPDSAIVQFCPSLKKQSSRLLLANSITLTPGTISVEADGDTLTVHCLESISTADLSDSGMLKNVRKLEENQLESLL